MPVGYALFALVLGVSAGLATRRTVPAMALTLGGLLGVRIIVTEWLRPLLTAARVLSLPLDPDTTGYGSGGNILFGLPAGTLQPTAPDLPNAWIQSVGIVDAAKRPLTEQVLKATCPTVGQEGRGPAGPVPEAAQQQLHDCVVKIGAGYHEVVTYQPGERYWAFQWWELALFIGLSLLVGGYAFYRLRRPRS